VTEVHKQPEGFDLRRGPLVAENHRNRRYAELPCGFETEVSVDDLTIASNQAWDLESEFTDRGAHAIHCSIVPAWIACVWNQPVDRPQLDLIQN
jgi:hypothetical protein